jgi:hypothetical protein
LNLVNESFGRMQCLEKPQALLALALLFDVMRGSACQGLWALICIYLQCNLFNSQGSGEPVVWK